MKIKWTPLWERDYRRRLRHGHCGICHPDEVYKGNKKRAYQEFLWELRVLQCILDYNFNPKIRMKNT